MDLAWDGDRLSLSMPEGIDSSGASVEDESENVLWSATAFDPPAESIAPPVFPADWGWGGLPAGYLRFEAFAAQIDGDVNEMVHDDFWYQLIGRTGSLLEVLKNAAQSARIHAMHALSEIADPRAIRPMIEAMSEESAMLHYWAEAGLERMGVNMVYLKP